MKAQAETTHDSTTGNPHTHILRRWLWRVAWTLAFGGLRLWLRGDTSVAS